MRSSRADEEAQAHACPSHASEKSWALTGSEARAGEIVRYTSTGQHTWPTAAPTAACQWTAAGAGVNRQLVHFCSLKTKGRKTLRRASEDVFDSYIPRYIIMHTNESPTRACLFFSSCGDCCCCCCWVPPRAGPIVRAWRLRLWCCE